MPWIRLCHPPRVCVCARASIFSPSLYTRHVHTRTRRQTAAYPPINLSAETQYGTPVAILFTKFTYTRASMRYLRVKNDRGNRDTPSNMSTIRR